MRNLALLIALFPFAACTSGTDTGSTDTSADADTDTDTDTDADADAFAIVEGGVLGDCSNNMCTYSVTTTGPAVLVDLDMTETDDSYHYHEYHNEFDAGSTNADGTVTYTLSLTAVADPADVTDGTTLFYAETVLDGTTWLWTATDADGAMDCRITGDNVTYNATYSACTNVI